MVEANKFKLGLFVISALFFGLIILFILGFSEAFEEKINFITVFNESVQGLDIGAPVKYRGVSIGKVTKIAIMPGKRNHKDNLVKINMVALPSAIDPSVKSNSDSNKAKEEFFHVFFTKEVKKGLRCRIDMAGITGVKYIEIDYFVQPGIKADIDYYPPPGSSYVPSTPSLFKEISKNISEALIQISKIKFEDISQKMQTTLDTLNRRLNDPKIVKLIDRMDKISQNVELTSQNINESITKDNIKGIVNQIQSSLTSFDELTKDIKQQLQSAKIDKTTADVRTTLKAAVQMRNEISETLDSIIEFINYMNEDPSSIVRGKQQPEFNFKQ